MPRKKQTNNTTPNKILMSDVQQKWQRIISNSRYNNCDYILAMQQAWANNPYLQNARLKRISSYPKLYDRDTLETALKNPRDNEQTLREASWLFNYQITPLMKMAHLYPDILLYNYYILPVNVNKEDMQSPQFKREYQFVNEYMRKLNPKRKFRNIVLQTIREGKAFVYLRDKYSDNFDNVDFVDLQFLPSDWVKITYRTPQNGYGASFNMFYFQQAGTSVSQFAPEFEEYLKEMYRCTDETGKEIVNFDNIPSDVIIESSRTNFGIEWYYWKELDPRKCFVISFDDTDPSVIPVFTSAFLPASDLAAYRILQQELLSLPLSQVLTAEVPLNDDNKTGAYGNDTKISPELILFFQGVFDSLTTGLPVKAFFAPFTEFTLHKLDAPDRGDVVGTALQNFYSESALSGLVTTNSKPSIAQIKTSQLTETQFIKKIYDQLEDMMNRIFECMGLKYKFVVKIFGDIFTRKDEIESYQKDLMSGRKEMIVPHLAMHNMSLLDARCLCDLVDSVGIYKLFEPLQSGFNVSKKNGRPEVDDTELESDNSAISKDQGTNTSDGRIFSLSDEQLEEWVDLLKEHGFEMDGQ